MWRRVVSSSSSAQLRALASSGSSSSSSLNLSRRFIISQATSPPTPPPSLQRSPAAAPVEDVMPIATGHEREELQAELEERDIIEINYPVGPFGTKESPVIVKSYYDKRIVGCPGVEAEEEHDVVWFWLEKGKPQECPAVPNISSWKWLDLEVLQTVMEMIIIDVADKSCENKSQLMRRAVYYTV